MNCESLKDTQKVAAFQREERSDMNEVKLIWGGKLFFFWNFFFYRFCKSKKETDNTHFPPSLLCFFLHNTRLKLSIKPQNKKVDSANASETQYTGKEYKIV